MKICILADAQSSHTQKWAQYFAGMNHDVHIISFLNAEIPGVTVHNIEFKWRGVINHSTSTFSTIRKLSYLLYLKKIKRLVQNLKPDIIHAHYATSYGIVGVFTNFHPFIISVWGSDVIDFPKKSVFRKWVLTFILNRADYITATSRMLTVEVRKFLKKGQLIYTIPFGVNVKNFTSKAEKSGDVLTIGIVKALEEKYGIPYLIQAFARCEKKYQNIRLLIVGSGIMENDLKRYCRELSVNSKVEFAGSVLNDQIPDFLNRMDVFVMPSILESETFGVAVVEAASCGIPVIASNIGGLPEVVVHQKTGFLFTPKNVDELSNYMETLIKDENLRIQMGKAARQFVLENYDWQKNASKMNELYDKTIKE